MGFQSRSIGRFGFLEESKGPGDGFTSLQTSGLAFAVRPGNGGAAPVWSVAADGTMAAAGLTLAHVGDCEVERRPGFVCRRGRVLEVNLGRGRGRWLVAGMLVGLGVEIGQSALA